MKTTFCSNSKFRGTALKLAFGIAGSAPLVGGFGTQARADDPSFTFTATIPAQVTAGDTFTVPASITDVGGEAIDFNSFFQIYDHDFNYISQTFYTDQTFEPGDTLNYNVTLTAPSTPGDYFLAGLVFDQDYSGPIVSQEFFSPTFTVVPATVPEPSYGLAIGILLLVGIGLKTRRNLHGRV